MQCATGVVDGFLEAECFMQTAELSSALRLLMVRGAASILMHVCISSEEIRLELTG